MQDRAWMKGLASYPPNLGVGFQHEEQSNHNVYDEQQIPCPQSPALVSAYVTIQLFRQCDINEVKSQGWQPHALCDSTTA